MPTLIPLDFYQPYLGDLAAATRPATFRIRSPGKRQFAARSRLVGNLKFDRLDRSWFGHERMNFNLACILFCGGREGNKSNRHFKVVSRINDADFVAGT